MKPQDDTLEMRRMSATEWSAWHIRIVREARTARDAAIADMLVRLVTAVARGARTLALALRRAFGVIRKTATVSATTVCGTRLGGAHVPQPHGPRGAVPLPRGAVQGPRRGDCA
jgi:hypothetical protein